MAEKLDSLIHKFEFNEDNRSELVFSDDTKIRLNPETGLVELKADPVTGFYSTDADIYIITPLYNPAAVRQWIAFQATITHAKRGTTQLTTEGFRLHNGTSQYWWNGANWVVDTAHWNSEAEVATNIGTFPATALKLRVVINLGTTDKRQTPRLVDVKVGYKAKIEYLEDILYRSLIPTMRDGIRFITDYAFAVRFPGGLSLDLNPVLDASKIPFNVVDVDSVFDATVDPTFTNNLASSYNPTTRIVTLSSSIPVGNLARIKLLVEPEIVFESTSQDFLEVEKVPALVISGMEEVSSTPQNQSDFVANKEAGTALVLPPPYRSTMRFTMILLAPGAVDLVRFVDAVVGFMEENQTIRSVGLDERYRMMLEDEPAVATIPTPQDIHTAQGRFRLFDVLSFKRPATSGYVVQRVKLAGDMDVVYPEDPLT